MNGAVRSVSCALLLPLALGGCAIGYTRTLFVTKTNVGFDVSNTPPTFQLALARTEGVLGPQFENGQKLPVMASFKFRTGGVFSPAVGSAFATGDAAMTMAALYGDETPLKNNWQGRADLVRSEKPPMDSTLELKREPTLGDNLLFKLFTPKFQRTDVRPVFFGTDTSLGVKVAWSGMTGTLPDTARFGYNRTELAVVPIAMRQAGTLADPTFKMKMASLMATIDSGVTDVQGPSSPSFGYQHMQYFATGHAATLLSMQQDVRRAMLARLDPNKEIQKQLFGTLGDREKTVAVVLLGPLYEELFKKQSSDPVAKLLVDRLNALEPPGLRRDYKAYGYQSPNLDDTLPPPGPPAEPFLRFLDYRNGLELNIRILEQALGDANWAQVNGTPITPQMKQQLTQTLADMKGKLRAFDQRLTENAAPLRDAVDYFYR